MKKEVCWAALCAVALTACSKGTEARTPETNTQAPSETWSTPGWQPAPESDPGTMPPSSAPGSIERDRELPSTEGNGDEGFVVPDDPAGDDTMGASGTMPGGSTTTPGTPPGTTPPGTTPPGNKPPGSTTAPGTPPTPPRPGANPTPAPGSPTPP